MNALRHRKPTFHATVGWPLIWLVALVFAGEIGPGLSAKELRESRSNYEPAAFADQSRVETIRALFPEIERIYREHAIENQFPGIAFGLMLDGELVFSGSHGVADLESKIPVTEHTLFRIASMTKSVTAMAILQLRDQGKLRLDDPASRHLPELRRIKPLTADAPAITIRDLLTHAAGFPEDNPWGDWQLADTEGDLVQLIRDGPSFSNPPGVVYEYSNLGYALLGRIVTRVSRMPYQRYIDSKILQPLGMIETEWEYSNVPPELLAHGYRWEEERWKPEPMLHDGSFGAMGGLISSVDEFARYLALHLAAWPPRDDTESGPLKRSSLREMHQPWRISGLALDAKTPEGTNCPMMTGYGYGLGWSKDCNGRVAVGHSGGLPGFGSNWRLLPEYGIGVVALANRTYANAGEANTKVIQLLLTTLGLEPRTLPASAILEQRRDELIEFLPDWDEAALTSGMFAGNFFKDQSLELRRESARALFEKAGSIVAVGEMKPLNNLRGTFVIEGTRANVEIWFTLTPENPPRIQALRMKVLLAD
jgi:CubicO group peptidase (beta-lactamase class C family)